MQHTPLHYSDLETPTRYTAYETGRASPSATHIGTVSYSTYTSRQSTCSLFIVVPIFFPYIEGNNGTWRASETIGDGTSGALFMHGRNENMYKILTWKLHRKTPYVTVTSRREDNIKCDLIFCGMFWNSHYIINRAMTDRATAK